MAAYAAVISLAQTINRLVNNSHISIVPSFPDIILLDVLELEPLQQLLLSSNRRSQRLNTLDEEIRETVYKLEDAIEEAFVSHHLLQNAPPFPISIDLNDLKPDFDSFKVKEIKEEYNEEISLLEKVNEDADNAADDDADPGPEYGEEKTKMIGLSDHLIGIKYELTEGYSFTNTIALYGMAGIGKSTLARKIFEDPEIVDHFDCRAWVRVGQENQLAPIFRSILSQMSGCGEEEDDELAYESVQGKRYLIVLDDVWDLEVFDSLKELLPDHDNGSRVLATSTIQEVADRASDFVGSFKIPFLTREESWDLLRDRVFGDEQSSCTRQLERAGKKIAEKCDGLPLLIVTIAAILSKADRTPEYWNEVAEKKNSVFTDAYDQVSKSLLPSYNDLPQNLIACFLYMGILPLDYEVSRSSLVNLWRAEGFLGPNNRATFELFATDCLEELVSRNVVILRQKVSALPSTDYNTEKYHLHSTFLHLCVGEARKNKFHHVMNRCADGAEEIIEGQRRLCIQNNVLFAIKDLHDSISSVSGVRSLLCTGSFHQYPVPVCFGLRLLRVLDSLTIRFYEFPIEVVELIQLRYLSMTYDGDLPGSISKLWNLECLIVNRHFIIKPSSGDPSYMPMEIWDMKELKHLQVAGSDLPDPSETFVLPNLLTLLDVSAHSCTQRVLERVPNLQRLGIRTAFKIGADEPIMSYMDHIPHLGKLESFTITVNPVFASSEVVAPLNPPPPLPSIIYSRLGKLSLSGLGYPWEHMSLIGSMPVLEVLKLRCNACRGAKWEIRPEGFQRLQYLLIEDSDLVVWSFGKRSFRFLRRLSLKHCYKLKEIPECIEDSLQKIEVIDCSPETVSWAKEREYVHDVYVHSSWE